jgi:uncharacterized membrane protein YgcG
MTARLTTVRSRRLVFAFLALLGLSCAAPAFAQERILSYDSDVAIHADGSLDVEERITVRAEGSRIRRGIYRDFPVRYRDRRGNRVVVGFEMKEVLRDGRSEPWFTERVGNGVRINTGNDDFLPVPATYTYTLRYRTTRQLGFFAEHDELYWNAIGTGWDFAIESGSVDVHLPEPVPAERLHVEGYTGPQGAKDQDYAASVVGPGHARWRLGRPLSPREGLTVVLTFPKGIVAEPTRAQTLWWLLKDNRGVLVALAGLVVLLVFCLRRWRAIGRDPAPGVVIARYEPPEGHSPAALRYVRRMGHDARCFSADLLELAVKGCLRIEREQGALGGLLGSQWKLVRTGGSAAGLPGSQQVLMQLLRQPGDEIELKKSNATKLQRIVQGQQATLKANYQGSMFRLNLGSIGIAVLIAVASFVLAMVLSGGSGLLLIVLAGVLMAATVVVFGFAVRAPTPEGRRLLDEIEGLKLYLGVAEKQDIARLPGPDAPPPLNAERYQQLLPYAVALDVEDAWTEKFTLAVGAAAAAATTASIAWYRGGGFDNLGDFTRTVGNAFTAQVASASTPPGSSSGSGGGGSSGGGGGGGGGGGR